MNTTANNTSAVFTLSAAKVDLVGNAARNWATSESLSASVIATLGKLLGKPDDKAMPAVSFAEYEAIRVNFVQVYIEEASTETHKCNVATADKAWSRAFRAAGYATKPRAETKDAERVAAARSEHQEKVIAIASSNKKTETLEKDALKALDAKQAAERVAKLAKGKEAEGARAKAKEAARIEKELSDAVAYRRKAEREANSSALKAAKQAIHDAVAELEAAGKVHELQRLAQEAQELAHK